MTWHIDMFPHTDENVDMFPHTDENVDKFPHTDKVKSEQFRRLNAR